MSFPQTRLALSLALSLLWPATAFAQTPPAPPRADVPRIQIKVNFATVSAAELDKSGVTFDRVPFERPTANPEPTGSFLQYAVGDHAAQLLQMLLRVRGRVVQAPLITTANNVAATIRVATQAPDQKAGFLLIQSGLTVTPRINSDDSVTLHVALQTLDATGTSAAEPPAAILRTVRSGDVIAVTGLPLSAGRPRRDRKLLVFITPVLVGTDAQKADAGQFDLPSEPSKETSATSEKTISLDVTAGDLRAVLAMMEQQANIKASVQDSGKTYKPVYVHLNDASLPKALGAVARSAGAQIIRDGSGVYVFSPLPGSVRTPTPLPADPSDGRRSVTVTP